MMQLAAARDWSPKDLGLDLFVLKEKRWRPEENLPEEFVAAETRHEYVPDTAGSFE